MHATPELVAAIQREREAEIREDHLAELVACARACCNPSLVARLVRVLRPAAAVC